ncbi:hypothetical protein SDC9_92373 [bioreactor metagenome]|uniref:Uncharacterized protein n=1 Tax=bioreactor metagenome TaxID=1076179 RepID=A0A645A4B4_9ZZZZ
MQRPLAGRGSHIQVEPTGRWRPDPGIDPHPGIVQGSLNIRDVRAGLAVHVHHSDPAAHERADPGGLPPLGSLVGVVLHRRVLPASRVLVARPQREQGHANGGQVVVECLGHVVEALAHAITSASGAVIRSPRGRRADRPTPSRPAGGSRRPGRPPSC